MSTGTVRFTTRELSKRTWADFERFFSQVHGCACALYLFGRHGSPVARTAKEREELLGAAPDRSRKYFPHQEWSRAQGMKAVKELVWNGQAHGILVYARDEPVGWCNFGRVEELPLARTNRAPERMLARLSTSQWRITCLTTRMDHRRQGVASTALAAAVEAIRKRGGGWIEALPIAEPHHDSQLRKLRRAHGRRSPEVKEHLESWPVRDVPGVGRVRASTCSSKTLDHRGCMSMFERLGFEPVKRDELQSSNDWWAPYDLVVMRLKV
ncbi:GNAT family N-acetyltransferase [Flindersiella endophytica]